MQYYNFIPCTFQTGERAGLFDDGRQSYTVPDHGKTQVLIKNTVMHHKKADAWVKTNKSSELVRCATQVLDGEPVTSKDGQSDPGRLHCFCVQ